MNDELFVISHTNRCIELLFTRWQFIITFHSKSFCSRVEERRPVREDFVIMFGYLGETDISVAIHLVAPV